MNDERLVLQCPAKVNLSLEVLGRYADGYHQISSVMQTISLGDSMVLERANEIVFECDWAHLASPDNIVVKAAMLLKERTGFAGGARLTLSKRIPDAAGLGGGSSDAAAALRGLDRLWGLGLSEQELMEIAASLGSDVPFFLLGGTVLAQGRGEALTRLPSPGEKWLAVLMPPMTLANKTRRLYQALTRESYNRGEHTGAIADALRAGRPLTDDLIFNVFEDVAPAVFHGIEGYMVRLAEASSRRAHLAGSGPGIFAVFEERAEAVAAMARLVGLETYLASFTGATR